MWVSQQQHLYVSRAAAAGGRAGFVVDDGVGVVADPNTYAITTSGNTWRLAWLGDANQHNFQGTITCPVGGQFTNARFDNAYPGDTVTASGVQVSFDAVTDAATPQVLDLTATEQPLTYDLYIDGQPAIGAVVFVSAGVDSTTDTMPFSLYSGIYQFSASDKTGACAAVHLAGGIRRPRQPVG